MTNIFADVHVCKSQGKHKHYMKQHISEQSRNFIVVLGSPSLCTVLTTNENNCDRSDGTDRCELSAPEGFIDQWAYEATANPEYQAPECPATMVTGKPDQIEVHGHT